MTLTLRNLKDRRVVQWALAYAAGAWGLLQLLQLLSDAYDLSPVWLRVAPVLLLTGLAVVIVIAWYHGDRGAQRASATEIFLLATLLVIGGASAAFVARLQAADKSGQASAPTKVPNASVAVLPFRNFSSDKEQDYFSDGITEEILNALAQINGLQVAARTSSFAFKGKDIPMEQIGAQLHVAHVLEGSVRKAGDRLRITAQLINAETGFHMWSQQFDRDAKDVFAVQEEIARSVAGALKVALGDESSGATSPKQVSREAHDAYLLGLAAWNKRTDADLLRALGYFEQATKLQPDYAAAWAGVANTYAVVPTWIDSMIGTKVMPKARAAAEKALALDPDLPEAHAALGWVAAMLDYNWREADKHFEKAVALNPSYATALQWHGEALLGRDADKAIALAKRAIEADPLSKVVRLQLGHAYYCAGQVDSAMSTYEQVIAMDSTWASAYYTTAAVLVGLKDRAGAMDMVARMQRNTPLKDPATTTLFRGMFDPQYHNDAVRIARAMTKTTRRSYMLSLLHDREGALAALEEAVRTRNPDANKLVPMPLNEWLRDDPRFVRIVHGMKLEVPK